MDKETKYTEFINTIPHGLYKVFRRRMMAELYAASLEVSDQTVRNWEAGRTEPNAERIEIINRIADEVAGHKVYQS